MRPLLFYKNGWSPGLALRREYRQALGGVEDVRFVVIYDFRLSPQLRHPIPSSGDVASVTSALQVANRLRLRPVNKKKVQPDQYAGAKEQPRWYTLPERSVRTLLGVFVAGRACRVPAVAGLCAFLALFSGRLYRLGVAAGRVPGRFCPPRTLMLTLVLRYPPCTCGRGYGR